MATANKYNVEIGQRIRTRREQIGVTQEELAVRLGFKSKSSIAKIESGVQGLTQSKIKAIADALGTTPAYIMGW
jgi:transcriptional regulator with XRE-family HTH domain